MSSAGIARDGSTLQPNAPLDMTQTTSAQGAMCALLTPAIKSALRPMASGELLEIRVDDPTAREDIASWCRLSGHELVAINQQSPDLLIIYVRKK